MDASGNSVASAPLQHRTAPPETTWVAVIGERSIPHLRILPGVRGGSVNAVEPYSHVLPRSSSGWFSFDVVIIDGAAALQQLQQDQLEALHHWVKLGATLVLGTGRCTPQASSPTLHEPKPHYFPDIRWMDDPFSLSKEE
ncbi:MAG TPA: hypothetical protein VIK99_06545 [Thermaerobacter sp.]